MSAFHLHRPLKRRRLLPLLAGVGAALLLALLIVAISGFMWYRTNTAPLAESGEQKVIVIEEGASVSTIASLLEQEGIIKSATAFDWYTRIHRVRGGLQAGGYKFSPSESVGIIVDRLLRGDVATDIVTILPAQRLDQIKSSLIAQGFSQNEVSAAFRTALYADHPALSSLPKNASLEGYLYPETFQRTLETRVEDVLRSALDQMSIVLSADIKQRFAAQGLTLHEAVILASIVEREVSNTEDRAKVAQVFLKRYREGMMLGSDPTALYGALLAGIEPSVFADTPYNTRLYVGLPPGPINNVSEASLEAVANPADTDYLYFVSGDDGTTHFSYTLEEHEAATARYCIELCRSY